MSEIQEVRLFTKTDGSANNHKFYRYTLHADGRILCEYGRIGNAGQSVWRSGGKPAFDRLCRERVSPKKGYKPADEIIDGSAPESKESIGKAKLADIAATALVADPGVQNDVISNLISRLVEMNRHEIVAASGGKVEVSTDGVVRTALGILTVNGIVKARAVLDRMVADPTNMKLVDEYLTLVPQKVPAHRGWNERWLHGVTSPEKQYDFLDQLEQSVQWYETSRAAAVAKAKEDDGDTTDYSSLFRYRIREVPQTSDTFREIVKKYDSDKNLAHQWARLRPKRVFELVTPADDEQSFQALVAELGNVHRNWHGSRAFNILSILRRGLFTPPRTGGGYSIAGRMFGDGVYTSRDASKSLGYSYGYWSGSREDNCFMFLADVVMGEECRATVSDSNTSVTRRAHTERSPRNGKPYNSIEVRGGTAGVRNHEAIVWNDRQVQLRYLIEFDR